MEFGKAHCKFFARFAQSTEYIGHIVFLKTYTCLSTLIYTNVFNYFH